MLLKCEALVRVVRATRRAAANPAQGEQDAKYMELLTEGIVEVTVSVAIRFCQQVQVSCQHQ